MAIRLITAPATEPISLDEAKLHLRVDFDDDDILITSLIQSARIYCENWTDRAFVTQTWELVLDLFPSGAILIPKPPLQTVVSIKYDGTDGFEQTLSTDQYDVDNVSQPGWVVPSTAGWPTGTWQGINTVRIRYDAGYSVVPEALRAAMFLCVGQWYEQREDVVIGTVVNKQPSGNVDYLLRQYRVALGMA